MLTIADIMKRGEIFAVAATTGLREVAWELAVRNLSGAPVIDEGGRLVGTVTRGELVDPRRGPRSRSAADVMTEDLAVVRTGEPAREALRLLCRGRRAPLIVVDDQERVVGVVTTADVLAAVARGDRFAGQEASHGDPMGVYVGDCPLRSHG